MAKTPSEMKDERDDGDDEGYTPYKRHLSRVVQRRVLSLPSSFALSAWASSGRWVTCGLMCIINTSINVPSKRFANIVEGRLIHGTRGAVNRAFERQRILTCQSSGIIITFGFCSGHGVRAETFRPLLGLARTAALTSRPKGGEFVDLLPLDLITIERSPRHSA